MKLSKRDRLLLPVILIGLAILIWNYLNPPPSAVGTGTMLSPAEANRKREVAERTEMRLKSELEEKEPRIAQMAYDLPAEQLEPRVIRDLQTLATRAGVRLREVKPLRPRALSNATGARVPLEVRLNAPFQPNIVRFLYFVEDPAGKMVLDKLILTSANAVQKTVEVTAQISVFTRSGEGVTGATQGETSNANRPTDNS